MLHADQDTIAAISTPPGTGGLAVLRLSGPLALETIQPLFSHAHQLTPRMATFGRLIHADLGGEFDDCVVTYFQAPHSYTGEDVVEISIHGGTFLQQKLLEVLCRAPGVRPAGAGEYTFRGFLRGKFDLSQAEAVTQMIHARDAAQHKTAVHQLHGGLRELVQSMADRLIHQLSLLEAELDFSDQDIDMTPLSAMRLPISKVLEQVDQLLDSYFYGQRLQQGFRIPLVGSPNSGKSSLFNRLIGEDRAIVTDLAGTTRDTIERELLIQGHTVILVDTAGLRPAQDRIESIGVDRSNQEIQRADIVLRVLAPDTEPALIHSAEYVHQITVINKLDIFPHTTIHGDCQVSCVTGEGLDALKDIIYTHIINMSHGGVGGVILNNERHRHVFLQLQEQLQACLSAIDADVGPEYLASDLRLALDTLGEITGKSTPDDVLNHVFSGFCVGK